MRSYRIGSDHARYRSGRQRSRRPPQVPGGPASDPTQDDQAHCCGDLGKPAEPLLTLISEQICYAQAGRYRPVGLISESLAQRLSLCGILREPCLLLVMCREIGVDVLGAVARQLSVDARMQVVLFYRPTQRRHLTLLTSALRPSTPPFI